MMKRLLFLDGDILPTTKSLLKSFTPGILSQKGVFESMRAYNGQIFLLEEHIRRLNLGLKLLKIKLPYAKRKIIEYLYISLKSNQLKNARLRLTVWRNDRQTRLSIIVWPYQQEYKQKYIRGFRAAISKITIDPPVERSAYKSLDYLPFLLARRRAKANGQDEAILLNSRGCIVEGSYTNVFFLNNGVLYTPTLRCGCLKGITRQTVIRLAKEMNLKTKQTFLYPHDLYQANEAFVTNSLIEIMPLTYVQGHKIGKGVIGPVTAKLLKAYRDLI